MTWLKRMILGSMCFRLGLILIVLGGAILGVTLFPSGTDVPRDATWIFLPQPMLPAYSDYQPGSFTMTLDLTNSSASTLLLQLELAVHNATRIYRLGILQPLPVIESRVTASNSMGTASQPITNVTTYGTYFTRSEYRFNTSGFFRISLSLPLSDPVTLSGLGRRGTGFTFGSGYGIRGGPEVDRFMKDTTPSQILNQGLTLSTIYPAAWQLSLPETFPSPDKQFAVGNDRAASWLLNFTKVLPQYFVSVDLVWSVTEELAWRDGFIFVSGITVSAGAGILSEIGCGREKNRLDNQ